VFCLIGGVFAAVGGLLAGAGFLSEETSDPDGGADIGAGLLLLLGLTVASIGVVLLVVSLVLHGRSARRRLR
jgi:hypothetical protein